MNTILTLNGFVSFATTITEQKLRNSAAVMFVDRFNPPSPDIDLGMIFVQHIGSINDIIKL